MPETSEDRQFMDFILAQIDGKPKRTYAYTMAEPDENYIFELPDDAIIIKMEGRSGGKPIIFYLTEVDPSMPKEEES